MKISVDWSIKDNDTSAIETSLKRFQRHLIDQGFRESTISDYVARTHRFLRWANSDRPSLDQLFEYREILLDRHLSPSSMNNYSFAFKNYYKMLGEAIELPFMPRCDNLPYYFDQEDVVKIFNACGNLKHKTMLMVLFYGCLRSSELCNLDDKDVDLKSLTIRVREGKNNRDGIVYITEECSNMIKKYLEVRPPLILDDGRQPLFFTDYGNRWEYRKVHQMFVNYKNRAGVSKCGGVHVFSRHTPATIMISNGCNLRIVQTLLRHHDIKSTLRYTHVADKTARDWYHKSLQLE